MIQLSNEEYIKLTINQYNYKISDSIRNQIDSKYNKRFSIIYIFNQYNSSLKPSKISIVIKDNIKDNITLIQNIISIDTQNISNSINNIIIQARDKSIEEILK